MNVAEWIIVGILSTALLVFLIIGIITLIKWRELGEEATKIAIKSQDVMNTAGDVVENVRDFTSVGKILKAVSDTVTDSKSHQKSTKKSTSNTKE